MAVDRLKAPLGSSKSRATGSSGLMASLKATPLFSLLFGVAFAALLIFGFIVNLSPGAHRGEPVLRIALNASNEATTPFISTEPPQEREFVLRDSMSTDGQSNAVPLEDNSSGDVIIIRRSGEATVSRGVSEPLPELLQTSAVGVLPIVGETGLSPMQAYARPVSIDMTQGAPARIALIVGGLALNSTLTAEALRILPPDVSLAFAPYGRNLDHWTDRARAAGHEFFLQIPLEPFDYPDNDPGPHTLLTSLRAAENTQRLRWLMARTSGYAGVINHMGARFTSDEAQTLSMLKEFQSRGLMFIDDNSSQRSMAANLAQSLGHPHVRADVIIDADPQPEAIGRALAQLENLALERGYAVGVASILPITLSNLSVWVEQLENRGIVLVPATSLVLQSSRPGL